MDRLKLRVGQGIDIHPLVKGRKLVLGGVTIPHDCGLEGHSDADALLHAMIDALLGAAGKSDIGSFFPPSDKKWKDADSLQLLKQIWDLLSAEGWRVENVDCAVLLEAPKLAPHVPEMKKRIAGVLRCETDAIGIKATTAEKLGFIGRGEGILTQAVALLSKNG